MQLITIRHKNTFWYWLSEARNSKNECLQVLRLTYSLLSSKVLLHVTRIFFISYRESITIHSLLHPCAFLFEVPHPYNWYFSVFLSTLPVFPCILRLLTKLSSSLQKVGGPVHDDPTMTAQFVRAFKQSNKIKARQIDEYCRGVFPLLFSLFNIFYWCYYLL